jgi:hypothetical protein
MSNKLLLSCLLIISGVCFTACETPSGTEATSSPEARSSEPSHRYVAPEQLTPKLSDATRAVHTVVSTLQAKKAEVTKDDLLSKIGPGLTATQDLEGLLTTAIGSAPTDDIKSDLTDAKKSQSEAAIQLDNAKRELELKQKQEVADTERSKILGYISQAETQLSNVKTAVTKATTRSVGVSAPPRDKDNSFSNTNWIMLAAMILAAIVVIGLVVFCVRAVNARIWRALDDRLANVVQATVDRLKPQYSDLSGKISALDSRYSDVNSRLTDIQSELQSIGRLVRQETQDRFHDRTPVLVPAVVSSPVTPSFPVSVSDYVEEKQRSGTVVRPDFHKGILVVDPENDAELMLVRDSEVDGETIMVPRVGQFQTRQDFHTYFGKYYDCQNPMNGDVWIVRPAVVYNVPGGWQLREKGVLEVR